MDERSRIWGILLAAGRGTRFGREKHTLELAGVPLWQHARQALLNGGVDTVVVVGEVEGGIAGGVRRQDSVAAGLSQIPDADGFVLIHDAARPLASADIVRRVITRLRTGDVDGVVPAISVSDTIKRVSGEHVVETVDRGPLVAVQTPQGFDLTALRSAHAAVVFDATDDAAMVEANGGAVVFVDGDPANIKLTYPDDLAMAEALRSRHYE